MYIYIIQLEVNVISLPLKLHIHAYGEEIDYERPYESLPSSTSLGTERDTSDQSIIEKR